MRVTLVLANAGENDRKVWLASKWQQFFDSVTADHPALDSSQYDAIVYGDGLAKGIVIHNSGTRIALVCTTPESLLAHHATDCDLFFIPSALATLEARHSGRDTLVLAQDVSKDSCLVASMLRSVTGGTGLGKSYSNFVVGKRILYDLKAGTPVDFGIVSC